MNEEMDRLAYIKSNISALTERIGAAAERSGRSTDDITVIAVSKTVDLDRIRAAVEAGLTNLGESKVQELAEKHSAIGLPCHWHFIGHLQSNKAKQIVDKVDLIHSVDSLELGAQLQRAAKKSGRVLKILVQINISGEETKFGIQPSEVADFLKAMAGFENLKVMGLMGIGPNTEDKALVRASFKVLHKIYIDMKAKNLDNICMEVLSMGMSDDFEIAIEEGSNMIRVGTFIFGRRFYP